VRRVLVIGGTGAVGSAVLRALRTEDVALTFTFHRSDERARSLASELSCRAERLDVTDAAAIRALADDAAHRGEPWDALIHCAGQLDVTPALETSDEAWDRAVSVNARAATVACRAFARHMVERGRGDILLVGGLDRAQSLPVPVAWAACQGMLAAMTMALAKEVGPRGVRINMVALGLLDAGLSTHLSPELRADYLAFSALRRFGSPDEVAQSIAALCLHDTYINGKVIPINGGL
jgi:NAD(P)-dependent dehydrogenase (short-subunit alcohol dehydrogenase family)